MAFVFLNQDFVCSLKARIAQSKGQYKELGYELNAAAEEFYLQGPWSVTQYPAKRSPGTKNDYYSEAPYFWPDPEDPSKPYINRDGLVNPDRFTMHKNIYAQMAHALLSLSSAGYYLDERKYLDKAAEIVRVWYLDEDTRMNPNLNYGEAIINVCTGRKSGIIACTSLDLTIHALGFLEASGLYLEIIQGMKVWVREMMIWLTTSTLGVEESYSENNHGTWWNTHVATCASFINDHTQLDKCIKYFKENVVEKQIDPKGCLPKEMERTRTLHYSLFNLDTMSMMCEIAHQRGIDLWHYTSEEGKSVEKALQYVMRGIDNPYEWKHQQIVGDIPMDEMCLQYGALRLGLTEAREINKKRSKGCYMIKAQSPLGPVALLEGYPFE